MHTYERRELVVSEYALREGVLLDTACSAPWRHAAPPARPPRAERRAPHGAVRRRPDHSREIARLALAALRRDGFGAPSRRRVARDYLEAAALLANVGLFISHAKHHLHSYYVIRNSEHLTGLHRPRDRDHRPGRPLPPQERAEAGTRGVRSARRTTRARAGSSPACCASRSGSTAPTSAGSPPCAPSRPTGSCSRSSWCRPRTRTSPRALRRLDPDRPARRGARRRDRAGRRRTGKRRRRGLSGQAPAALRRREARHGEPTERQR